MEALNSGTRLPPGERPGRTTFAQAAAAGCAAVLLAFAPQAARAVDGIALELGEDAVSDAKVNLVRIGAQWTWNTRWFESADWHVGGYWDLQGGYWDNRSADATNSGLWEVAITPVFRLQQNHLSGISPYAEIGVGAHLLSETSVSTQRQFSTALQFGSHVGLGARFGAKDAYELGYRYQHRSNAGIEKPNNGINFHILRLGYWF